MNYKNFSEKAMNYIQKASRLEGNDYELKALCRQAYDDYTFGVLSAEEYYYIECICGNIDEQKMIHLMKDLKKSSKKPNIPVSPARDKFNTILLVFMFVSIITLVVLSFGAAVMSSYGRFQEGLSGLLFGTFLTRIAYCLCMLPIPVILYKKVVKNKILRGGFIFAMLLVVFFTFRNPVSDLWYLDNPKTIQLENAYMTVNHGGKRNFYHLCGNDKNGKQYSFDINNKRYRSENNLLEETEQTVTVTYLPHTEIILAIDYEE